jgi:hypothetical protein
MLKHERSGGKSVFPWEENDKSLLIVYGDPSEMLPRFDLVRYSTNIELSRWTREGSEGLDIHGTDNSGRYWHWSGNREVYAWYRAITPDPALEAVLGSGFCR